MLVPAAFVGAQQAGPGPGIPYTGPADCADLSDAKTGCSTTVGTIATQAANNVTITGGTINGTSVGASSRASGSFTILVVTIHTVATLPGTPVDGQRSFVTDADTCVFATPVSHTTGTVHCPVYYDAGAMAWEAG